MGRTSEGPSAPGPSGSGPSAGATGPLVEAQIPHLLAPALDADGRRLLLELLLDAAPDRGGVGARSGSPPELRHDAPGGLPDSLVPLVATAVEAGLAPLLRRAADRRGLDRIAASLRHAAHRQLFEGRRLLASASTAAGRLRDLMNRPPLALGSLAAVAFPSAPAPSTAAARGTAAEPPGALLRRPLLLLVPERVEAAARRAVRDLAGVEVSSHALPRRAGRGPEEALWLRASPPTPWGFRVPALEDRLLASALLLRRHAGPARLAALVELHALASSPALHWETLAQRAPIWRARHRLWLALEELSATLGTRVPEDLLPRLRPNLLDRLVGSFTG